MKIHLDLLHQVGLACWRTAHREAAGQMDRRPSFGTAHKAAPTAASSVKFWPSDQLDLGCGAQRKTLGLGRMQIRDVAHRAGLTSALDHGGAERTGAAGHDDMTIAIIHEAAFAVVSVAVTLAAASLDHPR